MYVLVIMLFAAIVFSTGVLAVNCPSFTTQSTCGANTDCQWHADSWGS